MTAQQPLLSIIIPVYNGAAFLASAIESIFVQQYRPLEILVIDDGSTDDTPAIVERLQESAGGLLRGFRQPNKGVSSARNRGLEQARGEWIAFLDADDLWPENSLHVRVDVLRGDAACSVVTGRVRLLHGNEDIAAEPEREDKTFGGALLGAGLFRRSVFQQVGGFDSTLRSSEDVDWFLRAREHSVGIHQIEAVTLLYRRHDASLTHQKSSTDLRLLQVLKKSLERRRISSAGQAS